MNTHPSHLLESAGTDAEMQALGAKLAQALRAGTVVYLYGVLGAGKTTFVRGLLRGLGFQDKVKSPTYTIVEPYETAQFSVFHFDLYRLLQPQELQQIGLEDYFTDNAVCLVEWPEKGEPLLPAPDLACYFDIMIDHDGDAMDATRKIRFEARTTCGEETLARL